MPFPAQPITERIMRYVEHDPFGGCWLWTGYVGDWGYGQIRIKGKNVGAHRASYAAFVSPIPEGLHVLHRCDIRECCNPSHLFVGTVRDNMRDRSAKGRNGNALGEKAWNAKITNAQAVEILRSFSPVRGWQKETAQKYGVNRGVVADLVRGKTFKNIIREKF